MSKYYTPEIEEFHVGFSYRYNVYGEFSEHPMGIRIFDYTKDLNEIKSEIKTGCLGVKYLDKEDIESLGFEFKGKALRSFFEMECQFNLPDTDSFWCKTLKIQLDEKYKTVKIEGYIASACEEEVLFTGKCKNKSEIKKILKQIGYEG